MEPMHDIHRELASLDARIAARRAEFEAQGVLHGPEREQASELDMARASLERKLAHAQSGDGILLQDLAADVAVLKRLFEHWVARTDRRSEGL